MKEIQKMKQYLDFNCIIYQVCFLARTTMSLIMRGRIYRESIPSVAKGVDNADITIWTTPPSNLLETSLIESFINEANPEERSTIVLPLTIGWFYLLSRMGSISSSQLYKANWIGIFFSLKTKFWSLSNRPINRLKFLSL